MEVIHPEFSVLKRVVYPTPAGRATNADSVSTFVTPAPEQCFPGLPVGGEVAAPFGAAQHIFIKRVEHGTGHLVPRQNGNHPMVGISAPVVHNVHHSFYPDSLMCLVKTAEIKGKAPAWNMLDGRLRSGAFTKLDKTARS
ncbi:hypothetical protein [Roseovarius salinarum]|uniref:hypothetical protein n=1 Tax=Roseovarius salinarum TaxID=1981892 RepID=UPI001300064B|nr:hypothetical protein [Roseovarius salinarum]